MLSYKLCKELKDAGFKQTAVYETYFYNEKEDLVFIDKNLEGLTWKNYVRCPTLEELMDACGDGILIEYHKDISFAWENSQAVADKNRQFGKTPSESVAKLWLKLNKK